jgi:hypothetical protein
MGVALPAHARLGKVFAGNRLFILLVWEFLITQSRKGAKEGRRWPPESSFNFSSLCLCGFA